MSRFYQQVRMEHCFTLTVYTTLSRIPWTILTLACDKVWQQSWYRLASGRVLVSSLRGQSLEGRRDYDICVGRGVTGLMYGVAHS